MKFFGDTPIEMSPDEYREWHKKTHSEASTYDKYLIQYPDREISLGQFVYQLEIERRKTDRKEFHNNGIQKQFERTKEQSKLNHIRAGDKITIIGDYDDENGEQRQVLAQGYFVKFKNHTLTTIGI